MVGLGLVLVSETERWTPPCRESSRPNNQRKRKKKRKQTRALNKLHICRCNEAAQPKPEERKMDGSGPTKATAHTD